MVPILEFKSHYVEINQQKYSQYHVLKNLKLCAVVHSNWRKPRPIFDVTDAKFEFEFLEDLDTLIEKERDNHG